MTTIYENPPRAAKKTYNYYRDLPENIMKDVEDKVIARYMEEEKLGKTPDLQTLMAEFEPYLEEQRTKIQQSKAQSTEDLVTAAKSGAFRDPQATPGMDENFDPRKQPKHQNQILEEVVAKLDSMPLRNGETIEMRQNELLTVMRDPDNVDALKYGIDPYNYGQPDLVDPETGSFVGRATNKVMNWIDAGNRPYRAGKAYEMEQKIANLGDVDPEQSRQLLEARRAEIKEAKARAERDYQRSLGQPRTQRVGRGGDVMIVDQGPPERDPEAYKKYLSNKSFGSSVLDTVEAPPLADQSVEAAKGVIKDYNDPSVGFSRASSQAYEYFQKQARQLALRDLGITAENLDSTPEPVLEQALALAEEYTDALWANEGAPFLKHPGASEFAYDMVTSAMPTSAAQGWLGGFALKNAIKAGKTLANTQRVVKAGKATGIKDALTKGYQGAKTLEGINEDLGVAATRASGAVKQRKSAMQEFAQETDKMVPKEEQAALYERATGRGPITSEIEEAQKALIEGRNRELYELDVESGAGRRVDTVDGVQEVVAPYRKDHIVESKFVTPKDKKGQMASMTRQKLGSHEGIALARKDKDPDELVKNIGEQLRDNATKKSRQVHQSAFYKESYTRLKKKGLVVTSDDLGLTHIVKPEGTKALDRASVVSAVREEFEKRHPGVELVEVSGKLRDELMGAGEEVGKRWSAENVMLIPKRYNDALSTYVIRDTDAEGILSAVSREVIGPMTQIWKDTVLTSDPIRYAAMSGTGNMMMSYVSQGAGGLAKYGQALTSGLLKPNAAKSSKLWKKQLKAAPGITYGDAVEFAKKYDIVSQSEVRQGLKEVMNWRNTKAAITDPSNASLKGVGRVLRKGRIVTSKNPFAKMAYSGAKYFDENYRLATFLNTLHRKSYKNATGKVVYEPIQESLDRAMKDTLEIAGNFNNLSKGERDYASQVFAFYSWRKFAAGWFVENVAKNPAKFNQFRSFVDAYNSEVDPKNPISHKDLAQWIEMRGGAMKIPGAEKDEKGQQAVLLLENPMGMGADVMNPDVLDMATPLARAGFILLFGEDPQTGEPVPALEGFTQFGTGLKRSMWDKQSDALKAILKVTDDLPDKGLSQSLRMLNAQEQVLLLKKLGFNAATTQSEIQRAGEQKSRLKASHNALKKQRKYNLNKEFGIE